METRGLSSIGTLNEVSSITDLDQFNRAVRIRESLIKRYLDDISTNKTDTYFIEEPVGLYASSKLFESESDKIRHIAILKWQLEWPIALMAYRMADLLNILSDNIYDLEKFSEDYAIYIEPRTNSEIGWQLVIGSQDNSTLEQLILDYSEWIPMPILLTSFYEMEKYGKCMIGGGLEGCVGGFVRSQFTGYPVTCSHVLSDKCQSVDHRLAFDCPDISLLDKSTLSTSGSQCFDYVDDRNGQHVRSTSTKKIKKMIRDGVLVHKNHPGLSKVKGRIDGIISTYSFVNAHQRITCDFPTLLIFPEKQRWFDSLLDRYSSFSKDGDSGSWVVDESRQCWVGMLVAGNTHHQMSLAIHSGALDLFLSGHGLKKRKYFTY